MLYELLVPLSILNRWANILVTLGTLINSIKHYLNCMDMKEILPSSSVELQMVVWPKFPPLRAMKVFLLTPVLSLRQYAVSSIGEFEWKTRWVMHHYWDNDLYLPLFFSKSPTLISLVKLLLREFNSCSSENWDGSGWFVLLPLVFFPSTHPARYQRHSIVCVCWDCSWSSII